MRSQPLCKSFGFGLRIDSSPEEFSKLKMLFFIVPLFVRRCIRLLKCIRWFIFLRFSKHIVFDSRYYVEQYPDVKQADINPLWHYIKFGATEGRDPSPYFDTSCYLEQYPDVKQADINPLWHYIKFGATEGRKSIPNRGTLNKLKQNSDARLTKDAIILISHDASQTGAPLQVAKMAKVITTIYKRPVVILTLQGGRLLNEFKQYGIVYNLETSLQSLDNLEHIEEVFRSLRDSGLKTCICNTVVCGILLPLLEKYGFNYINLVHELPTSIKACNFALYAQNIAFFSKTIVFSSNFLKNAFLNEYPIIDLTKTKLLVRGQGVYNESDYFVKRAFAKQTLTEKLKISSTSKIVVGCGYADLRKGIDLFCQVANIVINHYMQTSIHFLWVGEHEYWSDIWVRHDAEKLCLSQRIHFINFTSELPLIFAGVDLFILTSREDPFPTVVLEAMNNGLPAICFEGSGGITEILNNDCGVVVPYLDTIKMAEAIRFLLEKDDVYTSIARNAKQRIEKEYRYSDYVDFLLSAIPQNNQFINNLPLKVSVIIPNYNYAKYLEERLNTIIRQTIKPFEIIFLDDNSQDDSISIAKKILQNSGIAYKIIENRINQGCFHQWLLGIKEAKGDLVWIAEADDACKLNFLEKLIDKFYDARVNLTYCQSQPIDTNSNYFDYSYIGYTSDISSTKWLTDYCRSGRDEVEDTLCLKNTIPNASAVIFRKTALDGIEEILCNFKSCGDWMAYIYALLRGKIYFNATILNYHRRHQESIINKTEKTQSYFGEILKIQHYLVRNFNISDHFYHKMVLHVEAELNRLTGETFDKSTVVTEVAKLSELHDDNIKKCKHPRILFVVPDLEFGGGQMAGIRLANYFSHTHTVYIYSARPNLYHQEVYQMVDTQVNLLRSRGTVEDLRSYLISLSIDVLISQIWWSDSLAFQALADLNIFWIITMHGCYEFLLEYPHVDTLDPNFNRTVRPLLHRANCIVYTADKNLGIFNNLNLNLSYKLKKIYNGYDPIPTLPKDKKILGIENDDFVFGILSRAIKEKGWEEAIKATLELNQTIKRKSHLILIGLSDYANFLKDRYKNEAYIHFVAFSNKPSEWIQIFDVGLLPSYFISESLPYSVIEYLACGKPVIASDIGEIKHMIKDGNREAGILIPLIDQRIDIEKLKNGMQLLIENPELLASYQKSTKVLFEQFDMYRCGQSYQDLMKNFGNQEGINLHGQ